MHLTHTFSLIKKKKKKNLLPNIWGPFYVRALGHDLNGLGLGPALVYNKINY